MDQAIKDMLGVYGVMPDTERFLLSEQRMFVNSEFVAAGGNKTIDVIEPSTASYLTSIPYRRHLRKLDAPGRALSRCDMKKSPLINR